MSSQEVREKIVSLSHIEAQQERLVNDLLQYMIDLDLEQFEDLLDHYIMAKGIDKTISFLIFPFLDKIGILWQASHIHPAQEHVVTNIIRQKLIVGIESVVSHITVNKMVILFLPEGEYHELGLLYTYYLLKSRGVQVIYLGANVPFHDLEFITACKQPDYLYTHLTCIGGNFNFERFLARIHQHEPHIQIIVSGQLTNCNPKKLPADVLLKRSLSEVLEFIAVL